MGGGGGEGEWKRDEGGQVQEGCLTWVTYTERMKGNLCSIYERTKQ